MSTSRNALFILLTLPWLALLARPTPARLCLALLLPAGALALVFWLPLPHSTGTSQSALNRILITIENARAGEMNGVSGGRTPLFQTALNIGRDFPLTGAGVGSFPILARPDSPYRAPGIVDAYGAAHSMPLNLFAESGAVTALVRGRWSQNITGDTLSHEFLRVIKASGTFVSRADSPRSCPD